MRADIIWFTIVPIAMTFAVIALFGMILYDRLSWKFKKARYGLEEYDVLPSTRGKQ